MRTQGGDGRPHAQERGLTSGGTSPAHAWISDCSLQDPGTVDVCSWSHPVCGALLWQPSQIDPPYKWNHTACDFLVWPSLDFRLVETPNSPSSFLPLSRGLINFLLWKTSSSWPLLPTSPSGHSYPGAAAGKP